MINTKELHEKPDSLRYKQQVTFGKNLTSGWMVQINMSKLCKLASKVLHEMIVLALVSIFKDSKGLR